MILEILFYAHVIISALCVCAAALLGFIFWNAAANNKHRFTRQFLRVLSLVTVMQAYEVISATYRVVRVPVFCVPMDARIAALQGRFISLLAFTILILFLSRNSTKDALNGGGGIAKSGDLPATFWESRFDDLAKRIDATKKRD